jgi:hypothetical protein
MPNRQYTHARRIGKEKSASRLESHDLSAGDDRRRNLPYTALQDAILAHPTLAEGLMVLFSSVPASVAYHAKRKS